MLPAILCYQGLHSGVHKRELIGVSRLGLSHSQAIIAKLFPASSQLVIYRIDLCLDVSGKSVWDLAANLCAPNTQNVAVYKNRDGDSVYLRRSRQKTIVVYDRATRLRREKNLLAAMLLPNHRLTRLEFQLRGSAMPFRSFLEIHKYAAIDLVKDLRCAELIIDCDASTPMNFPAAEGLRSLISSGGLQLAAKRFPSANWSFLKRKFLQEEDALLSEIARRLRKSIADWLNDRIRFPTPPYIRRSKEPPPHPKRSSEPSRPSTAG